MRDRFPCSHQEATDLLNKWGLHFEKDLVGAPGRVLPPEQLMFGEVSGFLGIELLMYLQDCTVQDFHTSPRSSLSLTSREEFDYNREGLPDYENSLSRQMTIFWQNCCYIGYQTRFSVSKLELH